MYEQVDIPQPMADEIMQSAEQQGVAPDEIVTQALKDMLRKENKDAGK